MIFNVCLDLFYLLSFNYERIIHTCAEDGKVIFRSIIFRFFKMAIANEIEKIYYATFLNCIVILT
jgi:hypothetical protein